MARNGSGTYALASGNPVVTSTSISSTWANNTLNDVASALTQSVSNDGQTPITANLPMTGFKHTNVANATARTEYCAAGQAQDNTFDWLTSVAGTDTITASAAIGLASYAAGQCFRFVSAGANTGTSVTLNLNSLGAKAVTKNGSTALAIGDIPSGAVVEVVYDGTRFQLVGTAVNYATSAGTATSATSATSATTATNIAGGAAGSLPYQSGAGTTALLAVGTNGYVLTLAAGVPSWAAAPFATTYTSPAPAALSTGIIAENHGLSANPSLVQATFRCATAEAGYSIGDELKVNSVDAVGYVIYSTWANATQVGFTSNATTNVRVANKSTGAATTLTPANWTVVLRAWK